MDLEDKIVYMIWADDIYLKYVKGLSDEDYDKEIPHYPNSISKILIHMCQVYWSWYRFITEQDYSDPPDWDNMGKPHTISFLQNMHENILEYCKNENLSKEFTLQWDEQDTPVITTAENVIFNFITHQAYHRGQLAIYLRLWGLDEIQETDFNPYIYGLKQNN